ncbi:MAG: 50S ribosomal protein L18 [Nitrospinae bacterium]|nr:50S ribosomal protein L18 [Nitrospinota bacterium]
MELAMKAKRRLEGRKERIRAKVSGTAQRPRVSVHFSNRSIVAQMIDDTSGRTLAAVSTQGKAAVARGKTREAARAVAATLAEKAKAAGVTRAVFDRNGRRYHGRVKDFADTMREKGIAL